MWDIRPELRRLQEEYNLRTTSQCMQNNIFVHAHLCSFYSHQSPRISNTSRTCDSTVRDMSTNPVTSTSVLLSGVTLLLEELSLVFFAALSLAVFVFISFVEDVIFNASNNRSEKLDIDALCINQGSHNKINSHLMEMKWQNHGKNNMYSFSNIQKW